MARWTSSARAWCPRRGSRRASSTTWTRRSISITSAIEKAERLSGLTLEAAYVGVGGDHLELLNSRGTVAVSGAHREVTREDIERATEVARAVTIPSNREVLHVLPRDFTVDGQEGVKDPEGMSAVRLEVTTHIVHGGATALQNLSRCVRRAGVRPDELVVSSIASGVAVLSETERELGVAVADIGAGTTDIALYADGSPFYTSVIPLGGVNVTNDIAIGLRTNLAAAEQLKLLFGSPESKSADPDTEADIEIVDGGVSRPARKRDVTEIVDARMRELFEKIGEEMSASASAHRLPAGLVLTGGAARLANAADLARDVLGIPVRVAEPEGIGGLTDNLLTPEYATAIGLLLWAGNDFMSGEQARYEPPPRNPSADRVRELIRRIFP